MASCQLTLWAISWLTLWAISCSFSSYPSGELGTQAFPMPCSLQWSQAPGAGLLGLLSFCPARLPLQWSRSLGPVGWWQPGSTSLLALLQAKPAASMLEEMPLPGSLHGQPVWSHLLCYHHAGANYPEQHPSGCPWRVLCQVICSAH